LPLVPTTCAIRKERWGSPRSESRALMRSRPRVTRRRRSSSSQTPAKEYGVVDGRLLEILFEPLGQGFEHAGVRGELLTLAGDDLLRGALDELLVRELAAGALHLVLDA
jgi:hypothetical protein